MPFQPFVGEIMMWGGNFAMSQWAFCNGATYPISQNETLYSLIGTTYGGDGVNTFVLPDFQSRLPVHWGQGPSLSSYVIGQVGGAESVGLNSQTMPAHNHPLFATAAPANSLSFNANSLPADVTADVGGVNFYVVQGGDTTPGQLAPASVSAIGGSLPHENRMPTLCVTFVISLFGVYPSRN